MEMTAENLTEKYIRKPARVCPGCGSNRVWLPVTGGMRCLECKPPEGEPKAVLIAVEVGGGLRWSEPSDFDDEIASTILDDSSSTPEITTKPVPHNRDVFVSTRLDWFSQPISKITEYGDEETELIFRKLDERYFAWLYSRVLALEPGDRDQAIQLLWRIVVEALNSGVFQPVMLNQELWPTRVPAWYEGPVLPERCEF